MKLEFETEGRAELKGDEYSDTVVFKWINGQCSVKIHQGDGRPVTLSKSQLLELAEGAHAIAGNLQPNNAPNEAPQ